MPTYEYECSQCGGTFEVRQSMKDEPLTDCVFEDGCGAKSSLKRLIGSGGGVIFKGSGFYATDYKRNGVAGNGAKPKTEKPAESCAACPSAANGSCPGKEA